MATQQLNEQELFRLFNIPVARTRLRAGVLASYNVRSRPALVRELRRRAGVRAEELQRDVAAFQQRRAAVRANNVAQLAADNFRKRKRTRAQRTRASEVLSRAALRFQGRRHADELNFIRNVPDAPEWGVLGQNVDRYTYNLESVDQIAEVLGRYRRYVSGGRRYIIQTGDNLYHTLNDRTIDALTEWLTDFWDGDANLFDSDGQTVMAILNGGSMTISRPRPKSTRNKWRKHQGEFYPYLHNYTHHSRSKFETPGLLQRTLERLGCYGHLDDADYSKNCLWLAFEDAGLDDVTLQAIKCEFRMRKISTVNLKHVAKKHNLRIELCSNKDEGRQNAPKYGPKTGARHTIKLALLDGHYIHNFRTMISRYAMDHYDQVCGEKNWWAMKTATKRCYDPSKGIMAVELLKSMVEGVHKTRINAQTEGVYKTHYHDQVDTKNFNTLEYPDEDVRLAHGPRALDGKPGQAFAPPTVHDCECWSDVKDECERLEMSCKPWWNIDYEAAFKARWTILNKARGGSEVLKTIDRRVVKLGILCIREQVKMLRRAVPVDATIFFDFETCPYDVHTPYCVRYSDDNPGSVVHEQLGIDCGLKFLDHLCGLYGSFDDKNPPEVRLVAHNIPYDAAFILEHLYRLNIIERGTSIICGSGRHWFDGRVVSFKLVDSYKMIPMSLATFTDAFKLTATKEVMPYKMYTSDFVFNEKGLATKQQLEGFKRDGFKDHDQMFENLDRWGCRTPEGKYDMIKYSSMYCKEDINVLKQGYSIFRASLLSEYDIDCYHFPTVSGVADNYFIEQGAFEGVYEMSNVVRQFIANCSVGGRVMCPNNTRNKGGKKRKRIADFDGVSLYPSSMKRIPGYLKGRPKVWDPSVDLSAVDGYFLKIRVKSVPKKFAFPIACLRTKTGNNWTNELVGEELFVDRWTLEDLVKFSKVTYEIIQGYYFNEGRNEKVNDLVQKMFNDRLAYKKEANPLEVVLKQLLNSGYGKSGLKPIDTDTSYRDSGEKSDNFIQNHFNEIKTFTEMPNGQMRFDRYKEIDTHYNRQHCACEILSVSKNIMNEVMCLAEDLGFQIYITDTDSMHLDLENVKPLAAAYKEMYQRELIGKHLGQFHVDFKMLNRDGSAMKDSNGKDFVMFNPDGTRMKDDKGKDVKCDPFAVNGIFLGKKSYCDELMVEGYNEVSYHVRMKGIPAKSLWHKIDTEYGGNPMKLYDYLYEGNPVTFDLTAGGNCCFKIHKNHEVSTITKCTRTVHFPLTN